MYYILRADGSSLFLNPYPIDFCIYCMLVLFNRTGERCKLLEPLVRPRAGITGLLLSLYLTFPRFLFIIYLKLYLGVDINDKELCF